MLIHLLHIIILCWCWALPTVVVQLLFSDITKLHIFISFMYVHQIDWNRAELREEVN